MTGILNGHAQNIPADLCGYDRWVCWQYVDRGGDKLSKEPVNAWNGRKAESDNASTWCGLEKALATVEVWDCQGVGFMLGDGYAGVDFDHCRDPETGVLEDWAQEGVELMNSYTEVSPSGCGVKVFCRGSFKTDTKTGGKLRKDKRLEMYHRERYFAVTGQHVAGTPTTVEERSVQLQQLWDRHRNPPKEPPQRPLHDHLPSGDRPNDADVIARATRAKNGSKFSQLWSGDWKAAGYASQSEADGALVHSLAFWCGNDPAAIDRLFRQSGLMRDKWDREDYRTATINGVLSKMVDFYDWNRAAGPSIAPGVQETARKITLMSSREFFSTKFTINYLVKDVLVEKQHGLIGGVGKTMKTKLAAVEMGVAIDTGTPFCGRFEVPAPRRVAILSGESGEFTLQDVGARCARARGIDPLDLNIFWGFELPRLSVAGDVAELQRVVLAEGIEVLEIDPLYLCLLNGDQRGRQASNLFDVGSILWDLTEFARATGITLLLYHHCNKAVLDYTKPPTLKDLAFAGFSEWARQWILLGRRSEYAADGRHELWMQAGGSAGHCGTWAIDVDEGEHREDLTWEKWDVTVATAHEANVEGERKREHRKSDQEQRKLDGYVSRLRDVLRESPNGDTESKLRNRAGLNPKNYHPALATLKSRGEVEACQVEKSGRKHDGWRPTEHLAPSDQVIADSILSSFTEQG